MTGQPELPDQVIDLGKRAKAAASVLGLAGTELKNAALRAAAGLIRERRHELLAANEADLADGRASGVASGPLDRLTLTDSRLDGMVKGLLTVADLPDPVGEVLDGWRRPNGLQIERVRVPLGVVCIIYENRPNVTSDAFGLCLKSGNVALLRGSSSALRSNMAIAAVLRDACVRAGLPADCLVFVEDTSYEIATAVMKLNEYVDCLIPRGGPSLIQSIRDNATVPVIIDGDGNCHVYVDANADLDQALNILINAKTQRTSVCNAAESLVVHEAVAESFVKSAVDALVARGVELVGDEAACKISDRIAPATAGDFRTEYLDLKMSVAIVPDLTGAISHVNRYGSGHTEAILTRDLDAARRFCREVDAAAVVVNASTRFTDGEEFGFGAEIGISTQKLHARGPMGLRELTTYKYTVWGEGQVRG